MHGSNSGRRRVSCCGRRIRLMTTYKSTKYWLSKIELLEICQTPGTCTEGHNYCILSKVCGWDQRKYSSLISTLSFDTGVSIIPVEHEQIYYTTCIKLMLEQVAGVDPRFSSRVLMLPQAHIQSGLAHFKSRLAHARSVPEQATINSRSFKIAWLVCFR